jgi:hypothetical protein
MQRPGESLSALDVEALEAAATVEEAEDVDIEAWLASQAALAKQVGETVIDGKRIKIAVVDEGEENRLLRQARRPKPGNPRETQVDMLVYRRLYVAHSLGKAAGRTIDPESLNGMPPGTLTRLQTEIQRLSKYEIPERPQQDPFALSI